MLILIINSIIRDFTRNLLILIDGRNRFRYILSKESIIN